MTNPDVLVVGGGIGGLGAAYALARRGLAVRVLEQAAAFGEVGAGIQLAPNCTRILDDYGLLDEAAALGVLPHAMIMRDAVDGSELTRLDLRDLERRYGHPYLVIHRSDLHTMLLRACERAGVHLRTSQSVVAYANTAEGACVTLADGRREEARVVIAADGLHSVARGLLSDDRPVSSAYVAYRGTTPTASGRGAEVDLSEVVVYVGPRCHFVHYGLRGGGLLNQVAVFESPKARAGEEDWGTPDELDAAFERTCDFVREGLPHMWRDRWWRMYDREPLMTWVDGNIALLGDAAHPRFSTSPRARSWRSRTAGCSANTSPGVSPTTGRWTGWPSSRPTRPSGPSTAAVCSPLRAPGATCGTSTGRPAETATPCYGNVRSTTTRSWTGSTGRPPWSPPKSRRCSHRCPWRRRRTLSRRPVASGGRERTRGPPRRLPAVARLG
ncbi:FAD-dependent monooxygenase [Actinomadura luteofluorescens]|uniref:FAD-dependent monooxygenase n=1 Tax=Actinomadura luteofluorescens TaxID=46163 RepID=UPI003637BEEF